MVDVRCRLADDLKEFCYKSEAVCGGIEKSINIGRDLDLISVNHQVVL